MKIKNVWNHHPDNTRMASVGKKTSNGICWNHKRSWQWGNRWTTMLYKTSTLVPWVTLYNIKRHTQFGRCCPWTGKEVCMHNVSAWPNDPKMLCFSWLMLYIEGVPSKSTNNLQNIVEKWWNPLSPKTQQRMSFAEVDQKSTFAEKP